MKGRGDPHKPTALYRFYDAAGDLLYVGITNDTTRRFAQHAVDKVWWGLVDGDEIEWFPARADAEAAESVAIWQEQPRYNVMSPIRAENKPRRGERLDDMAPIGDLLEAFAPRPFVSDPDAWPHSWPTDAPEPARG